MGEQREITETMDLLDEHGHLTLPGYARRPLWRYERNAIRAPWYRIKEWDYYAVLSQERGYGIALTIGDVGYLSVAAICFLDFAQKRCTEVTTTGLFPRGRTDLPPSSEQGRSAFADGRLQLEFIVAGRERHLWFSGPDLGGLGALRGEIVLSQDPRADSVVIATSWPENRRAFYYNQKINCMPALGSFAIGSETYPFAPEDSFAVLDWGRGNWTYKNRWYWGSASGLRGGRPVGWNLGYGFSDRSVASENMLFYGGRAHKLDQVTFAFNPENYLEPWQITSNDGRFEMCFEPIFDRSATINLLLLRSIQHQLFGFYAGKAILDDGREIEIENQLGFAEDVLNWW